MKHLIIILILLFAVPVWGGELKGSDCRITDKRDGWLYIEVFHPVTTKQPDCRWEVKSVKPGEIYDIDWEPFFVERRTEIVEDWGKRITLKDGSYYWPNITDHKVIYIWLKKRVCGEDKK